MFQHPDGGERAHLNVEPRLAGNDADAANEGSHELLPVFEAAFLDAIPLPAYWWTAPRFNPEDPRRSMVDAGQPGAGEEEGMKENMPVLDLEVEEIETRERGGGCFTSSSTSLMCTCACKQTTTLAAQAPK